MRHRPPVNIIGMDQWLLHDMPRGDGQQPPAAVLAGQPVKEFHLRTYDLGGHTYEVVEWLYAEVRRENLRNGTATNTNIRAWVRQIGRSNDDAGHIIGNNQGGLGTVTWNIFPQSSNFNRGTVFASDVERLVHGACELNGVVKIWFRFYFNEPTEPCRPTQFRFFILLPDGTSFNHDLENP